MDKSIPFDLWLDVNIDQMRDMWESMEIVERYEMGGDFSEFCRNQYDDDYGL